MLPRSNPPQTEPNKAEESHSGAAADGERLLHSDFLLHFYLHFTASLLENKTSKVVLWPIEKHITAVTFHLLKPATVLERQPCADIPQTFWLRVCSRTLTIQLLLSVQLELLHIHNPLKVCGCLQSYGPFNLNLNMQHIFFSSMKIPTKKIRALGHMSKAAATIKFVKNMISINVHSTYTTLWGQ